MTPTPKSWIAKAWAWLSLDRADAIVVAGLVLVAIGCWDAYRPASFVIPGLVFVWFGLPPRPPFVARPEQKPRRG